jgi:putative ABC transport system ATP-binding protein
MADEIEKDTIVRVEGLGKEFIEGGQRRPVLNQLTASFQRGEFVILLGRSGSGKSTLLNLISGIEKPSRGDVTINGVTITRLRERQRTLFRRDHIGFIFQFVNLIPTLTALENITLPQELAGVNRAVVNDKAKRLLTRVGLADRAGTYPDKLSGGEQQRVAIARALAHDPLLVLADEPTGNLDELTGDHVLNILLELTRAAGKTLIMATHNSEMIPLADRVYSIHDGHLVPEGPSE